MMEKGMNHLLAAIEHQTKVGSESLQRGHLDEAQQAFEEAYTHAHNLSDPFTERACAFNLGALYIANGQPEKGLQLLRCAIPPANEHDGKSNGDLFYNFGLGYESLSQGSEAAKYFELAIEEYHNESNHTMEASVASRVGQLYAQQQEWLLAARAFHVGAAAHARRSSVNGEAECLSQQAAALLHCGRQKHALQVADRCMLLCQDVDQDETLGGIYNELGLTYTQSHEFARAATCFEMALPLIRGPKGDMRQEAIILQNLGAVYNSLGDYQRALTFHEKAASLHADLGNRNSQGQCFTNLAFAYSQLGDAESAGECYLHALQAARDTEDSHAQWQAMEGLGAVYFNEGQMERAIRYFKLALTTLTTSEVNEHAQKRIAAKLHDAIENQSQPDGSSVQILVNDQPRPPTRQESLQMKVISKLHGRRYQHPFGTVALGVDHYESDSDLSLRALLSQDGADRDYQSAQKFPRTFAPINQGLGHYQSDLDSSFREELALYATESDHLSRATARQGGRSRQLVTVYSTQLFSSARHTHNNRPSSAPIGRVPPKSSQPETQSAAENGYSSRKKKKKYPHPQKEGTVQSKRDSISTATHVRKKDPLRRQRNGLLRGESHDSEEEWQDIMRQIKNAERKRSLHSLDPISESETDKMIKYNPRIQPPSTESDEVSGEYSTAIPQPHKRESRQKNRKSKKEKNLNKLARHMRKFMSLDSSDEEWTNRHGRAGPRRKSTHTSGASRQNHDHVDGRQRLERDEVDGGRWQKRNVRHRGKSAVSESERSEAQEEEDSGSEESEDITANPVQEQLLLPPSEQSALLGTYEKPVSGSEPLLQPSNNYFSPETIVGSASEFNKEQQRYNSMNAGPSTLHLDEEEEPLYQTIPSLGRTQQGRLEKNDNDRQPPQLPPRLSEDGDEFLRSYLQQQRDRTLGNKRDSQVSNQSDTPLPQTSTKKSRACVIL